MTPTGDGLALATRIRRELAGTGLPPIFAKLYSQHTRLSSRQPGLTGWRPDETASRLHDAVRLIQVALAERDAGNAEWMQSMRRAAELLEWLAHPETNPQGLPLRLLSAAAYQLASYPARSAGLLRDEPTPAGESHLLAHFLRADFAALLRALTEYWAATDGSEGTIPWADLESLPRRVQRWTVQETARALGVLCAHVRWGEDARTQQATNKLSAISRLLLHDVDPYSWLLSKLCSEVATTYLRTSLRSHVSALTAMMTNDGAGAIERYLRHQYQLRRSLAWPSQSTGIERLSSGESFALCTPTGSGKTAVAELAILQSLFSSKGGAAAEDATGIRPLALYLTPSRALAAEVEARLSGTLRRVSSSPVVVTGLYGGADWGPTDAWLTSDDRTVLICTYEKGEALLRFLGPLFLHRLSLIVVDEAHRVQHEGLPTNLRTSESRPLRLESLVTRLLARLPRERTRVIALSAVASGFETALASWIEGRRDARPATVSYRSTRQIIGRLECFPNGRYTIHYDLLDGAQLAFPQPGEADGPFVRDPFPPRPPAPRFDNGGHEKRLRPHLFWAAMQLASPDEAGQQHTVLISVTQQIGGFAGDWLSLLEGAWAHATLPRFFTVPDDHQRRRLWKTCLTSCADYFGRESREYRLLLKGVAVHHGKMPGPMARLFVELIGRRVVHLVLATSTLSEGINLPFETVLIPTLRRGNRYLTAQEFANLAGRAGRPGVGTEGRTLVLAHPRISAAGRRREPGIAAAQAAYEQLLQALSGRQPHGVSGAYSPLATLIEDLFAQWSELTRSADPHDFVQWLEVTAPMTAGEDTTTPVADLPGTLDSLDGVLLAAIADLEAVAGGRITAADLESRLRTVWQHTYAYYSRQATSDMEERFVRRGVALIERIYPERQVRTKIYRTGLPPRSGYRLLELYPQLEEHLKTGDRFCAWDRDARFQFIRAIVDIFGQAGQFRVEPPRSGVDWPDMLRWWLDPANASRSPKPAQTSVWYDYVSQQFQYRLNWWLGSAVALAYHGTAGDEESAPPTLEEWRRTGLPWAAFWIKELIVWGTLEPVAAYLMARGVKGTRSEAEEAAGTYYDEIGQSLPPDELANAIRVRKWVNERWGTAEGDVEVATPSQMQAELLGSFPDGGPQRWRVVPVERGERLVWCDAAGYELAASPKPADWQTGFLDNYDFLLDVRSRVVRAYSYLSPPERLAF